MTQKQIAESVGISAAYLCQIIRRDRLPSWRVAKMLSDTTKTDPILWLDGTEAEIRAAINKDHKEKGR